MFDHAINILKGWPSPYALDKDFLPDPDETGIVGGMVVALDPTSGGAKKGCPNGYMPIFTLQGQNEFDVNGDVGNIISGKMSGIVAVGGYEIETTEYTGVTFAPNDVLGPDGVTGKVKAAAGGIGGTDMIVGVVSDAGPITNQDSKTVVRFWPVYLPSR
jgi:hypothetical protein